MANQPAKVNLYYLALKRITNAKINLILAITILFFVGALNVGKMKFCFDERIQTNVVANFTQIYEYEIYISKRPNVLEISSLAQLLSYLAKKMRPSTIFLKTKSLNLLK